MALPPNSPEERAADATHIVTGEVIRVYGAVVDRDDREGGTDRTYCIEMTVLSIENWHERVAAGGPLYVHAWSPRHRPGEGWTGPDGNRDIPEAGDRVRAFLREGRHGRLYVLEPDGFRPTGPPPSDRTRSRRGPPGPPGLSGRRGEIPRFSTRRDGRRAPGVPPARWTD